MFNVGTFLAHPVYIQRVLKTHGVYGTIIFQPYITESCGSQQNVQKNCLSSNSFTWVTEGGDLGTADWGCLAGRCASLCLQAAHGGRAAGGSG